MPEPKHKNKDEGKSLSFHEIVAKLGVNGITPQQIARMTMKQIHYAMQAIGDDMAFNARIAGCEVEEEDVRELTVQDLPALAAMLGG